MNKELMYYCPVDAEKTRRISSNPEAQSKNMECNCNRAPETILCTVCGGTFVGRKRIQCQRHKNTIHLMDCVYCVFCKKKLK
ncbi:hypothetical protein P5673_022052 [Acropora cervicornis]|uniref:Uncharacterized protein n=1 Tax=Acropora cervicornis TaxID=6130 RepID=A0AAD9Q7B5_ACRCE|nr:hypothetical protein P5673_022052 [Acropora cervicornis]